MHITSELIEWDYHSDYMYDDPFNTVDLDVVITSPKGEQWKIPTFWRGKNRWSVRFIAKEAGTYHVTSICSDTTNITLHHQTSILQIKEGKNILPTKLNVSQDKKYLIDEEKKPFFWLSDTWWMALSSRLSFPDEFTQWTNKRKEQGFNVIMLVAGLMPDMDSFDNRAANEAGLPWKESYHTINPDYFDEADTRIDALISVGLIPCILGSWGYYLLQMGEEKIKQHWRYIIARWGAYPVVWCIAGEATMPFYLSKQKKRESYLLKKGWTNVAQYINEIEPFDNLITIHPTEIGRKQLNDETLIDFNLIQSSHYGYGSITKTYELLNEEQHTTMPLLMGESNYEGILKDTGEDVQRLTFWTALLSGSKGYSYGANGIWQINTSTKPFGDSPHGENWGNTPWEESLFYHGATQLGYAKELLEPYEWWKLKPQPECIYPYQNLLDPYAVRAAGIESTLRILYFYNTSNISSYTLLHLYPSSRYNAFFWDPSTSKKHSLGSIISQKNGSWEIPNFPSSGDWILVLKVQNIYLNTTPKYNFLFSVLSKLYLKIKSLTIK